MAKRIQANETHPNYSNSLKTKSSSSLQPQQPIVESTYPRKAWTPYAFSRQTEKNAVAWLNVTMGSGNETAAQSTGNATHDAYVYRI